MATNPFNIKQTGSTNPFNTGSAPVPVQQPFASTNLGIGVNTFLGLPKALWTVAKKISDTLTSGGEKLLSKKGWQEGLQGMQEQFPLKMQGGIMGPSMSPGDALVNLTLPGGVSAPGKLASGMGIPEDFLNSLRKFFVKETKPSEIESVLREIGHPKKTIKDTAELLSKAKTEVEVDNIFKSIETKTTSVGDLSKTATNSLENVQTGTKPGSIDYAKKQIQNGNLDPINVRTTPEGTTIIEDGRHRLQAAKELNLETYPVNDVSSEYLPKIIKDAGPNLPQSSLQKTGLSQLADNSQTPLKVGGEIVSSPKPTPQTSEESISTFTKALQEAKPIRGQQEAIYTKTRSERIGNVLEARKTTGGEAGFQKELGQLKGEMTKVEFESLRGKISQDHIDNLFNMVRDSPNLDVFETISARNGLMKMFSGSVPTEGEIKLLSHVFPKEVIGTILSKRPLLSKLGEGVINVLNVPRSIMSSFDLSAPFRQGIFFVGKKEFWNSFGSMLKSFGSERVYKALQESIINRPTYDLMKESKLAIMDTGKNLADREEKFLSNLAEKIPGIGIAIRASGRAYTGFLNKVRADVFDNLLANAKTAGVNVNGEFLKDLSKFINSATGRGSIGSLDRTAQVLNGVMFSPRLMMSRLNLLNPQYYASLDPFVRKQALKSLLSFASISTTILGLAKAGGATVNMDPRNADFGKIKIGNTRIDTLGGFQQYIRLGAQFISGKIISSTTGKTLILGEGYKPLTRLDIIERFFQRKENPVASFITDWLEGEDLVGNKFKLSDAIVQRIIPMMAQDSFEVFKDGGFAKGLGITAASMFGFGTQTYKNTPKKSLKSNPFSI